MDVDALVWKIKHNVGNKCRQRRRHGFDDTERDGFNVVQLQRVLVVLFDTGVEHAHVGVAADDVQGGVDDLLIVRVYRDVKGVLDLFGFSGTFFRDLTALLVEIKCKLPVADVNGHFAFPHQLDLFQPVQGNLRWFGDHTLDSMRRFGGLVGYCTVEKLEGFG